MVEYALDAVTDDMVLARSIFTPTGELLLAAGFRVTQRYRKRLKQLGFQSIFIEVEGAEEVIPETIISEHLQREMSVVVNKATDELKQLFLYKRQTGRSVKAVISENRLYIEKFVANSGVMQKIVSCIDELINLPSIVLNISALDKKNSQLLAYTINVTLMALCLGIRYRFSGDELKQLGMGAINYDIGMVAVPDDILNSIQPLSDDEQAILRDHTAYGHLMLSQIPTLAATSAAVAFQHHERQDGSGYPRHLTGDNRPPKKDFSRKHMIHRFAEIVAVADTYEMLISGRSHFSRAYSVRDALHKMVQLAGTKLNADIVKNLISVVPVYPVGSRIRVVEAPSPALAGYQGVVARINAADMTPHHIILFETKNHQKIKPFLIDMSQHRNVKIELVT